MSTRWLRRSCLERKNQRSCTLTSMPPADGVCPKCHRPIQSNMSISLAAHVLETDESHSIKANTSKRKKNKLVTLRTSLCIWKCEMCRLQCRARIPTPTSLRHPSRTGDYRSLVLCINAVCTSARVIVHIVKDTWWWS